MQKPLHILFILLLMPLSSLAQDTTKTNAPGNQNTPRSNVNKKAIELERALVEEDVGVTAGKYEKLAKALAEVKEFVKAEEYLLKALDIYQKRKDHEKAASVKRTLAQVHESQMNFDEAISNYQSASEISRNPSFSRVNSNDVSRLQNQASPEIQEQFLESNIQILEEEGNMEEVANVYRQRAETGLRAHNKVLAIESYEKAITISKDKPEEVQKLKSEISMVYVLDNQIEKAVEVTTSALQQAIMLNLISEQIHQKQALASLLFRKNDTHKAIALLNEAYETALEHGRTFEAKEVMLSLSEFYRSGGNHLESLQLHERFLHDLDKLIQSDSSLMDARMFQVTEEKIRQLEAEKILKDELITSTGRLNNVLFGSVLLMLVLLAFIARALFSIKTRNKKIALQSLRREMNPHFIFNSLNSVNQFIAQNNELQANKYLTSYSNLMRNMMETSNQDFITLSNEIGQINKYLKLEHLRFSNKFDYEVILDEELDAESVLIPNMLIQPHLENAIWHGLRYREGKGMLKVSFSGQGNYIKTRIEDNGIGIQKSLELKTLNQKVHESRGLSNVKERIKLLNELYRQQISFTVSDNPSGEGTIVEIISCV